MNNSNKDQLDHHRKAAVMEDSNSVTIEFLRARLLSERSVSRSAKQRADELAKRVEELEEQLKIVSLQRKLAEKATADVLAILEDQGISEDEYDFSSDQEVAYEPGAGDISTKEEKLFDSNIRRSVSCEPSGSDHDSPLKSGRSLSWKGRGDSPSLEKYRNPNMRWRGSWKNFHSAPKHHPGKSCRQIRRKENRSVAEKYTDGCAKEESQKSKIGYSSEEVPNSFLGDSSIFRGDPQIQEEKVVSEVISNNNDHYSDGYARDKDMEKALEHQAQLIGQYEAMEKAQREWEEKFREHSSSTPDSCDPGNQSDITEERDDVKAQVPYSDREMQITNSRSKGVRLSKEARETTPDSCMPTSDADKEQLNGYKNAFASASGDLSQHFPVSATMGKHRIDGAENFLHHLPGDCQQNSHSSPKYKSEHIPQSFGNGVSVQGVPSVIGNNQALVPHEQPHELRDVLNSLKQAKLALQQKINTLPLIEYGHSEKAVEPSLTPAKTRENFEIPVRFSGLFRLPTEVSEPGSRSNFLSSPSCIHSENSHYEKAIALTSGDKYAPSPKVNTGMSLFLNDLSLTRQYREAGPRLNIQRLHFDPYVDKGMFPSTSFSVPSYPIHHSYQDLMQQSSSSRASPRLGGGVPPAGHFNYNNNVYR